MGEGAENERAGGDQRERRRHESGVGPEGANPIAEEVAVDGKRKGQLRRQHTGGKGHEADGGNPTAASRLRIVGCNRRPGQGAVEAVFPTRFHGRSVAAPAARMAASRWRAPVVKTGSGTNRLSTRKPPRSNPKKWPG